MSCVLAVTTLGESTQLQPKLQTEGTPSSCEPAMRASYSVDSFRPIRSST